MFENSHNRQPVDTKVDPVRTPAYVFSFASMVDFLCSFRDARQFGLELDTMTNFRLYFDKEAAERGGMTPVVKRSESVFIRTTENLKDQVELIEENYPQVNRAVQVLGDKSTAEDEFAEILDHMQEDPVLQTFYGVYQAMATQYVDHDDPSVKRADDTIDISYLGR